MSKDLSIPEEFIKENQKIVKPKSSRKGGPYSKKERHQRENDVFKLHFDYGYSARQIAETMKINRHTIDNDINHLYSRLSKEWPSYDLEAWYMKQFHRLESQRARLFQQLEKQKNLLARLSIEKMILDIDTRIMNMFFKIVNNSDASFDTNVTQLNAWTKKQKLDVSFVHTDDITRTSTKTQEKIKNLIDEDRKNRRGKY